MVVCTFLTTFVAKAERMEKIIEILKHVETNNRPDAIGDNGDSYGVLQIQWAAVQDVNRYFGTSYTHNQMFRPECAEEVALLYMRMGAELYRERHGKEPTEEVLVRNHNGGVYRGYRIRATIPYYRRYLKFKSKLL